MLRPLWRREDLTAFPPSFFICVPLVLDTLHTRVRYELGAPHVAINCTEHCGAAMLPLGRAMALKGLQPPGAW